LEKGFDFGYSGDDATNSYKPTEMDPFDFPHCHGYISPEGLKVKIAVELMRFEWQSHLSEHVLSSQQMVRKASCSTLQLFVAFATLMQNNVDYFVMFADIFGGLRQKLVHDFAKQTDISTCIVSNTRN
jgi:hypothetical protein